MAETVPPRPPRACSHVGCKLYSYTGKSYCDKHYLKPESGWHRTNCGKTASQNGYGAQWRKLRDAVLIRDRHLCQPCHKLSVYTPAKQVDHIINKAFGGDNSLSNLQSICIKCHKAKTALESALAKKLKNKR